MTKPRETDSPTTKRSVDDIALVDALARLDLWRDEDGAFDDQVVVTEALFASGELSAAEAAQRLGLSLEEFVRDFVIDENFVDESTGGDSQDRHAMAHRMAAALRCARDGISLQDFVCDVLTSVRAPESVRPLLADDTRGDQSLGRQLRRAIAGGGGTLTQFITNEILPDALLRALEIAVDRWPELRDQAEAALRAREECIWNRSWFTALDTKAFADRRSVEALDAALAERRITDAARIIAAHRSRNLIVSPGEPNAVLLLWCYARWIQFDFSYLPVTEAAVTAFARVPPRQLRAEDTLCLGLVEAIAAFYRERYETVLKVVRLAEEIPLSSPGSDRLRAWYAYFEANVLWKNGQYTRAQQRLERSLSQWGGSLACAERASLELLLGWLRFLRGEKEEAHRSLAWTSSIFAASDDCLSQGDVQSFQGRLERDSRHYRAARIAFMRSITSYSMVDPMHPNIGRSHINLAITFHHQLQAIPAARGRVRLAFLRRAMQHLDAADALYRVTARPSTRGLVKVHVTKALVYHAAGEWEHAERHAVEALRYAEQMNNPLLIAEAKRLSAMTCGDPADMMRALDEARDYAADTDNRRLKAKVLQLSSSAAGHLPQLGAEQAARWRAEAERFLESHERDCPAFAAKLRVVADRTTNRS